MRLFFDRNIGKTVPRALSRLGLDVEWHDSCFSQNTPDEEWLQKVGDKGCIVITHHRNFAQNKNELQAVIDAQVRCFVLPGSNLDRWHKAMALAYSWDKIRSEASSPAPFIWKRSSIKGRWSRVYPS